MTDGLRPVNLIITPMQVLDGEKHEVAILLIKPDQRKNDVEISIRMLSLTFSCSGNVLIQDGLAVRVCLVEYTQRTIYPNREFVDKLTIFTAQFFSAFQESLPALGLQFLHFPKSPQPALPVSFEDHLSRAPLAE